MLRAAPLLLLAWLGACGAAPDAAQLAPAPDTSEPRPTAADALAAGRAELAARLVELALQGEAHSMLRELTAVAPLRLSGSPGAEAAVAWARDTMVRIGLQNVRLQPVMVPRWVRGEPEVLELLVPGEPPRALPVLALGGSIATPPEGITAEVVMVRSFEQLRELGERARGKIAFFNRPMPRILANTFRAYGSAVPQRTSGAAEAGRVGAVAALVRSMTTSLDDFPHTGALRYEDDVPRVPAAAVSTRGAEEIARRLRDGVPVRLRLRMSCDTLPDVESANVIGEIPGTERPDEVVLVGGHLDAWDVGHGAHDDGAGCAHGLEAARLLLEAGVRPRRTIRVVLFMNEENGLRGAIEYANAHRGHVAAIESDAGGHEPRGFTTTARGERKAALAELLAPLQDHGMGTLLPGGGGADISRLRAEGTELFGLLVNSHRYFDYHHSARDVVEAVHERELAMGAAALAYLAAVLADGD